MKVKGVLPENLSAIRMYHGEGFRLSGRVFSKSMGREVIQFEKRL